MENNGIFYGCLLKVKDIAKVKAFYRDILELVQPLVDSNFWVEFQLPGNGILVLEQSSSVVPGKNRQDVSCLIVVDDLELRLKALESRKVKPIRSGVEVPGCKTATVTDPEGNLITLYSRINTD